MEIESININCTGL